MDEGERFGGLAGLPPGRGVKRYRDGHRVMTPDETLERVMPLMPKLGVTRLADLTGLDRLRLPVFAAYRPNSRSLAAFQGKGASAAAAKASALMEAAETYCAEVATPPLRLASAREIADLGEVVDIDTLPRSGSTPIDREQPILWTLAVDITTGAKIFVPFEIVHADYSAAGPVASGYFSATTNGLASGNDFLEAVAHALYEVVERDAVALWSLGDAPERAARRVALSSVDCHACRDVLNQFARADIEVGVWDVTSDIGLPAFHCLIADREAGVTDPEIGSGCHASRSVALMRALTEAAQSRATFISGSRDDFQPLDYQASARAHRLASARDWLAVRGCARFGDAPTRDNGCLRDDLIEAAALLARVGLRQILAVDLTHPAIGVPVARVVVPGLEGVAQAQGHAPGLRGQRMRARRG